MTDVKKTQNNNYILLSVGSLLGFLLGFVLLLANLPDYKGSSDFESYSPDNYNPSSSNFEFYNLLPGQNIDTVASGSRVYQPHIPALHTNLKSLSDSSATRYSQAYEVPASYAADTYYLQAGSFRNQSDAEKMRAKLLLNGLDAFVKPSDIKGKIHHRVRLGPYYDQSSLGSARESLHKRGISYMVLRVKG